MNFSSKFGIASYIWYPASGYRGNDDGSLNDVGNTGNYWSASPYYNSYYYNYNNACLMYFSSNGYVSPFSGTYRANGQSVRCLKESK